MLLKPNTLARNKDIFLCRVAEINEPLSIDAFHNMFSYGKNLENGEKAERYCLANNMINIIGKTVIVDKESIAETKFNSAAISYDERLVRANSMSLRVADRIRRISPNRLYTFKELRKGMEVRKLASGHLKTFLTRLEQEGKIRRKKVRKEEYYQFKTFVVEEAKQVVERGRKLNRY